jgi:hypothetical protein
MDFILEKVELLESFLAQNIMNMNKRLVFKILKQNEINRYNKNNSKRIIIGTLKPNCDKSLNKYNQ